MRFIMMIGLPGSGKSTMAEKIAEQENAVILSSDKIREELYGNEATQGEPEKVFALMHQRTKEALKQGKNVIYDATNVTAKNRRGIMQELKGFDIEKEAVIVARPYEDCLKMNAQRERKVPEEAIERMYKNFQMPYYFEGFTNIKISYPNPEDKEKYGNYCFAFKKLLYYDQNNPWHPEDLGTHLLDVHERLQTLGLTDDNVIYQTALIHDVGKPFTRKLNPETGYCSYFKHANVGAYMSMFYEGLEDPVRTAAIITYHNDTIEWNRNVKTEMNFKNRVGETFYKDVKIIGIADHPYKDDREKYLIEFKNSHKNEIIGKEKGGMEIEL